MRHVVVDWARILELQEDLGEEDFDEVIAMFLEEVEDRLASLKAGSFDNLAEELHFLKGSAANLGFVALHKVCHSAEMSCSEAAIVTIIEQYEVSKADFEKGIAEGALTV